jgi:predicted anti-sigma-YlaC factor YlaD
MREICRSAYPEIPDPADDRQCRGSYRRRQHSNSKGERDAASDSIVLVLAALAVAGLVVGLATGVGLFGWVFAALVAIYLVAAYAARTPVNR